MMGHNNSNMIGIRSGGVFSGGTDMEDTKARINKIILGTGNDYDVNPDNCMSRELTADKGAYIVFAGVFNYWGFDRASEFCLRLSIEFGSEVMLMSWDEVTNEVQCQIFLDGKPLFRVSENPIGRALRMVT